MSATASGSGVALRVDGLGKRYRIGARRRRSRSFRETVSRAISSPFQYLAATIRGPSDEETLWALRGVGFEVRHGEVLGVIGRNGAGKSTLLKILSRITDPTEGFAEIRGRVGCLLEVGTGFHPELTGRENVYLNGAILGMRKREIDLKFDEIVGFAEVERFIDTPVKRYSSGMRVRLGFAVAAHLDPEILIVDEVLAVGDAAFQRRCLGKMDGVARSGRTVLFVSHNMAAMQSLCPRSVLLEDGGLAFDGPTEQAVLQYLSNVERERAVPLADREDRSGGREFRFTDVEFLDPKTREPIGVMMTGQPVVVRISYECTAQQGLRDVALGLNLMTTAGLLLFTCPSQAVGTSYDLRRGAGAAECYLPRLPLREGQYAYGLYAGRFDRAFDIVRHAGTLDVHAADYYGAGTPFPPGDPAVMVDYQWMRADETPARTPGTVQA